MQYNPANPLIVQGDRTILLEVDNPLHSEARDAIAPFAELEKSPEHIHTYRLTDLSLWNAAAAGMSADAMMDVLRGFSKYPVPSNLAFDIAERVSRYGRVRLERNPSPPVPLAGSASDGLPANEGPPALRLVSDDVALLEELARQPKVRTYLGQRLDKQSFLVDPAFRGL